jgi:hypothetical protein
MADGGTYFDRTASGPHAVTDEWLNFEANMRRRRVGRCLLRADLAIDDGCLADARRAIEEARQLDSNCVDLKNLETRLDSLHSFPPESVTSLPQSWRWVGSSAFVVVLLSGTAIASYSYWRVSIPRPAATGTATPTLPALRIEQETVNVPVAAPDLLGSDVPGVDPMVPPMPAPPIAEATIPQAGESIVLAVNRELLPQAAAVPEGPRSDGRLDQLPGAPSPSPQAPARAASAAATNTAIAEPAAIAISPVVPAAIAEPKPIDESLVVRSVLNKYERAYSSLDAGAASAVWPGVDRAALARAFEGLASQRVSLKSCDVAVDGAAARAQCSGTATWVPKVGGGGARTAARQWEFELRKRDGDWEIERAIAR